MMSACFTDLRRLLELSRKGLDLSIYSSGDEGYAYGYEQIWWNAAQMEDVPLLGDRAVLHGVEHSVSDEEHISPPPF